MYKAIGFQVTLGKENLIADNYLFSVKRANNAFSWKIIEPLRTEDWKAVFGCLFQYCFA